MMQGTRRSSQVQLSPIILGSGDVLFAILLMHNHHPHTTWSLNFGLYSIFKADNG
jgi:hypothetical protein